MLFANNARKKKSDSDLRTLVENQKKEIKELENTIKQLEFKNIVLREKYDLLVYKRFVRASEALDKAQPVLFDEAAAETGTEKEAEKETITCQRNEPPRSKRANKFAMLYLKRYMGLRGGSFCKEIYNMCGLLLRISPHCE